MHKRRYADLNFGQIHYREAGTGLPVLLLHQSPRTSEEHSELIDRLSSNFRVIAPDNPGNGMSDPLGGPTPTMHDYARALIQFVDVLNLETVMIYGFHTGGSIATAAATGFPDRVTFAIANGLSILRGEEKADILEHYAPAFHAHDDGSHLMWLWQRFQKQSQFFPWYKEDETHRINVPPYSAEKCQGMVEDILMAGNNYIAPYKAAFAYDPVEEGALPADNLLVMSADADPLAACLEHLPADQAKFTAPTHAECLDTTIALLNERASRKHARLITGTTQP